MKRGLFPGGGGTTIGTRLPLHAALEMTLTGDFITADRGYQLGLINAVVEADAVLDTALGFAERIAANAPSDLLPARNSSVSRSPMLPGPRNDSPTGSPSYSPVQTPKRAPRRSSRSAHRSGRAGDLRVRAAVCSSYGPLKLSQSKRFPHLSWKRVRCGSRSEPQPSTSQMCC